MCGNLGGQSRRQKGRKRAHFADLVAGTKSVMVSESAVILNFYTGTMTFGARVPDLFICCNCQRKKK